MSRRKSGLAPEDLEALKHLPAVLRALEKLAEEHDRIRRLMGRAPPPPADLVGAKQDSVPVAPEQVRAARAKVENPILDTPERREYERARRAGAKVADVDPFANASEAQKERMAAQREYLRSQGRIGPEPDDAEPPGSQLVLTDAPIRVETLTTISGDADG